MRALLIDENIREQIKKLIAHAEKNEYTMDDMLDRMNKAIPIPGDMTEFTIIIPMGFKAVFTIEEQKKGKMRHLSVSVAEGGRVPNPGAVEALMKEFGFENEPHDCIVYFEEIAENHQAVNVLEYLK